MTVDWQTVSCSLCLSLPCTAFYVSAFLLHSISFSRPPSLLSQVSPDGMNPSLSEMSFPNYILFFPLVPSLGGLVSPVWCLSVIDHNHQPRVLSHILPPGTSRAQGLINVADKLWMRCDYWVVGGGCCLGAVPGCLIISHYAFCPLKSFRKPQSSRWRSSRNGVAAFYLGEIIQPWTDIKPHH